MTQPPALNAKRQRQRGVLCLCLGYLEVATQPCQPGFGGLGRTAGPPPCTGNVLREPSSHAPLLRWIPPGFDVAVATKACELTGLTCEMVPMIVADRIPKLKDGSVDMLFAGGLLSSGLRCALPQGQALGLHACADLWPGSRCLPVCVAPRARVLLAWSRIVLQASFACEPGCATSPAFMLPPTPSPILSSDQDRRPC